MKKFIIIFAVLLMLAGGAVSIMKAMELGPFAPMPEVGDAQKKDGAPAEPKYEPPRFVDVDLLIIPIFLGEKVATTIQVSVKLEAIGYDNMVKIHKYLPRLNDAFLRDLYSYIPRALEKEDRVDVFIVKKRLQRLSDKVVGPGIVDSVLVQAITDTARLSRKKPRKQRRTRPQPTVDQPTVIDQRAVNPAPTK